MPLVLRVPASDSSVTGLRRAVDFVVCNPRSEHAVYDSASDKVALAATVDAEGLKLAKHSRKLQDHGFGYESFELVPFAVESSGAWSRRGCRLWKEMKAVYKGTGQDNYVMQEREHTWSAFTFMQMVPQRVSFAVHYYTALKVIEGVRSSRFGRSSVPSAPGSGEA